MFQQNKDWFPKLPALIWLVLLTTFISCFARGTIMGFAIKGYAWVAVLLFSGLTLLQRGRRPAFPLWHWLPWLIVLWVYLFFSPFENALQRTLIMTCPILVGLAASRMRPDAFMLQKFLHACRTLGIGLFIVTGLNTGLLLTGQLPAASGLAAEAMTAALLACLFASQFAGGNKKILLEWGLMASIPLIAVTRTGILAAAQTLPFSPVPLRHKRRVAWIGIFLLLGLAIFYSERVQKKMFWSGSGSLEDIRLDNPDFRTHGRNVMWEWFWAEIQKEPTWGHGANAQEDFLFRILKIKGQPHNDWIRLLYDYGAVGTISFVFGILFTTVTCFERARKTSHHAAAILFYTGVGSFVVMIIFMFTDNIILYSAYFANLQFLMMGLAYGASQREKQASINTYTYSMNGNIIGYS